MVDAGIYSHSGGAGNEFWGKVATLLWWITYFIMYDKSLKKFVLSSARLIA